MIPDPSTAESQLGEGGSDNPVGEGSGTETPSPTGHLCAGCGQPLEDSLRDMWCFASPNTLAYWPCLLAADT